MTPPRLPGLACPPGRTYWHTLPIVTTTHHPHHPRQPTLPGHAPSSTAPTPPPHFDPNPPSASVTCARHSGPITLRSTPLAEAGSRRGGGGGGGGGEAESNLHTDPSSPNLSPLIDTTPPALKTRYNHMPPIPVSVPPPPKTYDPHHATPHDRGQQAGTASCPLAKPAHPISNNYDAEAQPFAPPRPSPRRPHPPIPPSRKPTRKPNPSQPPRRMNACPIPTTPKPPSQPALHSSKYIVRCSFPTAQ